MKSFSPSIVIHDVSKLRTPEQLWDPYPWYQEMLMSHPVHFDEKQNVWNVFRYDDVNRVLSDWSIFSNRRDRSTSPIPPIDTRVNINSTDPPVHRDIRGLVSKAFTPKSLQDWKPRIAAIVKELIQNFETKDQVDIVNEFAIPLPVTVIADLLGVPYQDRHYIKEWSDILFIPNSEEEKMDQQKQKYEAMQAFHAYLHPIVQEKRKHPANDIISDLTLAEYEGDKLSDEEIVVFSLGLLAAGNETTTNLIANCFYIFLYDRPGTYQELRETPSLIPNAIEEALRYRFPITIDRQVVADTDVLGVPMKAGDIVLTWIGAANVDPLRFPDPLTFDIRRPDSSKHLAFGKGPHFCLGAPLARMEAEIALTLFAQSFADIGKTGEFDAQRDLVKGTQNLGKLMIRVERDPAL